MIDTTVPGSPGWWMQQLWRQLKDEQPRLDRLDRYRRGEPDIVMGSERLRSAFFRFQNMSRSNFAELIVSAMTNRMALRSIRTAAVGDDDGDSAAWRIHTANGLDVGQTDLYRLMGTFGGSYVAVGTPQDPGGEPVVTIEDPRQVTTAQDALRPGKAVAAFKLYHDAQAQADYAILWLPGEKWVGFRPRKARATQIGVGSGPARITVSFSPSAFTMLPFGEHTADGIVWDAEQPVDDQGRPTVADPESLGADYTGITSEKYDLQEIPVVKFGNRDGVGEFELHTDILDRIAHVTLQQMVIATLQAFKQRAIELDPAGGDLPDEDENGNPIDYDAIFEADPGALWRLPAGAKIWESGQVDMQGILLARKDDVLTLAATTQTPFPMFSPDSANQSANGASLYREGLTFKVEDRCRIAGAGWAQVYGIAFKIKGDAQRGDAADIIVDWAPADRYSIIEQAQADALSTLPRAQKYARIYGMSPADVKVALGQANQDMLAGLIGGGAQVVPPEKPVTVGDKATAFGELIRSGVTPESAAKQVGLDGVDVRPDLRPITLRPTVDPPPANGNQPGQ